MCSHCEWFLRIRVKPRVVQDSRSGLQLLTGTGPRKSSLDVVVHLDCAGRAKRMAGVTSFRRSTLTAADLVFWATHVFRGRHETSGAFWGLERRFAWQAQGCRLLHPHGRRCTSCTLLNHWWRRSKWEVVRSDFLWQEQCLVNLDHALKGLYLVLWTVVLDYHFAWYRRNTSDIFPGRLNISETATKKHNFHSVWVLLQGNLWGVRCWW